MKKSFFKHYYNMYDSQKKNWILQFSHRPTRQEFIVFSRIMCIPLDRISVRYIGCELVSFNVSLSSID